MTFDLELTSPEKKITLLIEILSFQSVGFADFETKLTPKFRYVLKIGKNPSAGVITI